MKAPGKLMMAALAVAMTASGCSSSTEELREAATDAAIQGPADQVLLYFDAGTEGDIDATVALLGTRLTSFGFTSVDIDVDRDSGVVQVRAEQRGDQSLSVTAPLLATPGRLEFRPVLRALLAADPSVGGLIDNVTRAETDLEDLDDPANAVVVLSLRDDLGEEVVRYELGPVALGGDAISSATAGGNPENYLVSVDLADNEAVDALNDVAEACRTGTPRCPTGQLGVVLDDRVLSVPAVGTSAFTQHDVRITGLWTIGEAAALAAILNTAPADGGADLVLLTALPAN